MWLEIDSFFWTDATNSHLIDAKERVSFVRHDLFEMSEKPSVIF